MQIIADRSADRIMFDSPGLETLLYLPGLPGGGSRIHDRSSYGNHGTLIGATWVKTPGGLWCLNFDGSDDYIDCGTGITLANSSFTLEAWVSRGIAGAYHSILCQGTD
ncbi:MAG: hypothetical protein Q8O55_13160 [Dehalococcoidales bacterium]|nr:hypothetical protein [Dehalococcoidales bacterium]